MHQCPLTWCPYNCKGYCYTDLNQVHYMALACDYDTGYIPYEMQNHMTRKAQEGSSF